MWRRRLSCCSSRIAANYSGGQWRPTGRTRNLNVVIRWDEKAGLRTGCGVRSQVIDVLEGTDKKETGNEEG